jgi:hypothetical protein
METHPETPPTPRQAEEALRQIADDQSAVRYPPLPRWFFPVMSAVVAALFLAQMLAPSDARNATFALAVVAIVLGSRYWLHRSGVSWPSVPFSDIGPFLAAILGIAIVCVAVSAFTDLWWIWTVGAVAAGGVILRTGRLYRREFGDDL